MRHRAELGVLGNDDEVVETTSAKKISKKQEKIWWRNKKALTLQSLRQKSRPARRGG